MNLTTTKKTLKHEQVNSVKVFRLNHLALLLKLKHHSSPLQGNTECRIVHPNATISSQHTQGGLACVPPAGTQRTVRLTTSTGESRPVKSC